MLNKSYLRGVGFGILFGLGAIGVVDESLVGSIGSITPYVAGIALAIIMGRSLFVSLHDLTSEKKYLKPVQLSHKRPVLIDYWQIFETMSYHRP